MGFPRCTLYVFCKTLTVGTPTNYEGVHVLFVICIYLYIIIVQHDFHRMMFVLFNSYTTDVTSGSGTILFHVGSVSFFLIWPMC